MNFDLSSLDKAGKKTGTARSSLFNPRLKPRARPRAQQQAAEPSSQPDAAPPEEQPAPDQVPRQDAAAPAPAAAAAPAAAPAPAPAALAPAGTTAPAEPVTGRGAALQLIPPADDEQSQPSHAQPLLESQAQQRAQLAEPRAAASRDPQRPAAAADSGAAASHRPDAGGAAARLPPSGRRVRFAPAAAPAARPRAPPQPPAAPSADAAATPAADTSSEEEEWPDDTLAPRPPPPVRLPPAIGRGRGRPPARTVGSQRRAATAPGGSQTGGRDGAGAQGQKRPAPAMMLALPPKRNPNLMVGGRPQVPERLDVDRMSLKDVIRWSNSKERETLLAEKQRKELQLQLQAAAGGSPPPPSPAQLRIQSPPSAAAAMAPQVSIVNGQIVVDQATLTVQAQPEDRQRTIVEDTQRLNTMSYAVNRNTSERWQEQETENFYRALSTFGSDFTLIASLFPGKNRRQIKNKYTKECKVNAARIDEALKTRGCNTSSYEDVIARITYDTDAAVLQSASSFLQRSGWGSACSMA